MGTKTVININTGSPSGRNVGITKTKRCYKCGREFPATPEYFYRNVTRGDGLADCCKECKKKYQREYNKKHVRLPTEIVPDLFKPSKASNEPDSTEDTPDVRSAGSVLRKCKACGKLLPLTSQFFNPNPSCRGGFEPRCRECKEARYRPTHTAEAAYGQPALSSRDFPITSLSDEDLISELGRRGYSGELTFSRKLVI